MNNLRIKIGNILSGLIITSAIVIAYAKRDSIQAMFNGQNSTSRQYRKC